MMFREIIDLYELLDTPSANGEQIKDFMLSSGASQVEVVKLEGKRGSTDEIKILVRGSDGKTSGGDAPTLGVIGRLGGLGARPSVVGFTSDGDGALAALAVALKLSKMHKNGDVLAGDVIIATHICPDAPTQDHFPVPFMDSPISMAQCNAAEVDGRMDAILSIDTTKGNRVINLNGIAISNTVKSGYILEVSNDLMDVMTRVTGKLPAIFPLAQQDITPYGNSLHHLNSILQPATETDAPVVGVAIATEQMVAGCATGATHATDVEEAARFAVEVAKGFGTGAVKFYDEGEYAELVRRYGEMTVFKGYGDGPAFEV